MWNLDGTIEDSSINIIESQISSGSKNTYGSSIFSADFETFSGNITLRLTASTTNYEVNIDIVSGDALINEGG